MRIEDPVARQGGQGWGGCLAEPAHPSLKLCARAPAQSSTHCWKGCVLGVRHFRKGS